jgi:transglutaminase-like putative cysteine protease
VREQAWSDVETEPPLVGYRAAFVLTWQGARMGSAVEELRAHRRPGSSLRFTRREHIVVRRGTAEVLNETTIVIDTDHDLRPIEVRVQRTTGATLIEGRAHRLADGRWQARFADEPARTIDVDAVPAELVPLLIALRHDRRFDGEVFMPGSGFAVAHLRVRPARVGSERVTARVDTPLGVMSSNVGLLSDGTVRDFEGDDGVGARRVDIATLDEPFDPPELVDNASIPLQGRLGALTDDERPVALVLRGVHRPRPPELPGQRMVIEGEGLWHFVLEAADSSQVVITAQPRPAVSPEVAVLADTITRGATDRRAEVLALARGTERLIEDDLGAGAVDSRAALALGRGDCTAHAILFVALAHARGISARVVTGYRVDGARLVRHRWAIAQLDRGWIAVDPTYGEAPAAPRLLGLAVHGETAAELAVVDSLAFSGMADAHAHILPWRE